MKEQWPGLPTFVLALLLVGWSVFMASTTHLPPGTIINLELARSGPEISAVICSGEDRVNEAAVEWNTKLDCVLIPLYAAVLSLFSLQSIGRGLKPLAVIGMILAVSAAAFDIKENCGIFQALKSTTDCSFTDSVALAISNPSWIKWSLFFAAMMAIGIRLAITQKESRILESAGIVLALAGIVGLPGVLFRKPEIGLLGLSFSLVLVLLKFLVDRVQRRLGSSS